MKRLLITAAVLAAPSATRCAGTRLRARQRDLLLQQLQLVHGEPRYDIAKELRAKIK
jgi:hypothetical protein